MKMQIKDKSIWLNYHHLYCFSIIASEGNLAKASKKLGIGQSALSIQLKQFEENLGFNLFDRSHRKLSLNDSGLIILSYAKEIFRLGTEMLESVNDRPSPNRIHIQIGALDTIPKHLTVEIVNQALNTKRCSATVVEGKSQELLIELLEHKIDLLVTNRLPQTPSSKIYCKKIARLPLFVAGGPKFIGLKKGFPKSLQGVPLIVPTPDSGVRMEIQSYFKKSDTEPDMIAETQDVMVQKLLALNETGLTIMPEFAIREYIKQKKLFIIGKMENCFEELYLITASRKIENPIAAELMKTFVVR